jgi:LacI family transcriptional regulator
MKKAPRIVTIEDVAREAGVGLGTVSRVLNHQAHVSHSTQNRVLASIRRLKFVPHSHARRMGRRRAEMVCFILSNREFLHPFHARIFQGVERCAREWKHHVVFVGVQYDRDARPSQIPLPAILQERGSIDGLILAGMIYGNFIRRMESLGIPFVAFGNNVLGLGRRHEFDEVLYDARVGVQDAIEHLYSLGHRSIAYVGDISFPWFQEEYDAYIDITQTKNLRTLAVTSLQSGDEVKYGEWAASVVLREKPLPTAVFAGNDQIAYGLWRLFKRRGVRIPNDMSLVGFDDTEEALLIDPPLTTVRVDKEKIGYLCIQTLLERLSRPGRSPRRVVLPTKLVIRETVSSISH